MKKFTFLFAALLASASMFASKALPPKAADLANYYEPGQLCVAVYFEGEVCNDIVFAGTYNGWSTALDDLAYFQPVAGFDGWYVVAVTDMSETIAGKPIQLQSDGTFSWDYQTGDADSWTLVSGYVSITNGYSDESDLTDYSTVEPVVLISSYFHKSPCNLISHTYTVILSAPMCGSNPNDSSTYFAPAIIGGFNNWEASIPMQFNEEDMTYSYTFESVEGKDFKFKAVGDINWENEIEIMIDGEWYRNPLITLADQDTIYVDYSEGRYAKCANPGTTLPLYDFESESGNADWVMVNGTQINQWTIGSATAHDSNQSLYISNNGTDHGYNNEAPSAVWAYLNTPITGDVNISFDWKGFGESCCDYMKAYLIPAASIGDLYAGSEEVPGDYNFRLGDIFTNSDAWQSFTSGCVQLTGNYYLAFMWRNDGSVGSNPIAIDNVQVQGITYESYQISITAGDNGSLSAGDIVGTVTLDCNTTSLIGVCATPDEHYKFVGWSDGVLNECRNIYLTQDTTIVAQFEAKQQYSVQVGVDANSAEMGTVSGSGRYEEGDIVIITASAKDGYHFVEWSDGSSMAYREFVLSSDITLYATFAAGEYGGKCGKNLYWNWEDGALSITGTGDMNLFAHPAWWQYPIDIQSVSFSATMTSISAYAFYGYYGTFEASYSLKEAIIPANITNIGYGAFADCPALTKWQYNGTEVELEYNEDNGNDILWGDEAIQFLQSPAALVEYRNNSWSNLDTLIVVSGKMGDIPSNVRYLDLSNATNTALWLNGWEQLRTLYLPNGYTEIADKELLGCKHLEGITIPANVTRIGESAFEDCRSMTSVMFAGNNVKTIGDWAFYNCHSLRNLTLPEGVEEIGTAAFFDCTYLSELTLPSTMKKIADNGFAGCEKMQTMYVNALVPPTIEAKTFEDVDRATPVFVPRGTIGLYQADTYWSEFFNMAEYDAPSGNLTPSAEDANRLRKVVRNGQVLIIRGNEVYNILGETIQ